MGRKFRIILSLAALLALGIFLSQWCQVEKEKLVSAESQEFDKAVVTEIITDNLQEMVAELATRKLRYVSCLAGERDRKRKPSVQMETCMALSAM